MFVIVGALLVVALFGALIAPYFIDWSVYKRDFEIEASKIVGQTVKVGGDAKVRLLPMPSVTFQKLQVGENEDGTPMTTVDEFFIAAELMPFLSGEIRIKDLKLVRPKISIQVNADGKIAWTDRQVTISKLGLDASSFAAVKLENVSVEDGSIIITDKSVGREISIQQLYAGLSAQSLLGPWRVEASGSVDGLQSRFTINTGAYQPDGSIRVKFSGGRIDLPYSLLLDGPVSMKDGLLAWDGKFSISPLHGDALARAKEAGIPLDAEVEGQFNANPKIISIPEYRLEIGDREDPYVVTGRGGIDIAEDVFFRVQADGRQLDLGKLESVENAKALKLEDRVEALKRLLDKIPLPTARGEISLELPAIVAGDTLIREVSALVRPVEGGWDMRSLRMIMPGNTVLEASGRLGVGESFGFDGRLLVASRQPSGFAAWISGQVDTAVRRLSSFGLSANLTVSPNQTTFDQLELVLDKAVLKGKVQRIASGEGKPGIIAILVGDQVDLDDLRAIYALSQDGDASGNAMPLSSHDLDLRLNAKQLRGKLFGENLVAENVDAHIRVQDGSLAIEKLNMGAFFGASVTSSGRISDLLDKPNGNVKFNILAKKGNEFAVLVRRFVGANQIIDALARDGALSADSNINIEIDATSSERGSKGQALFGGIVGGTKIKSRVGFNGRLSAFRDMELDVSGSFSNETPHILLSQTGLDVLPLEAPGPLSITTEIAGVPRDGLLTLISASTPGSDATVNGLMTLSGDDKAQARFDVAIGSKNIQPFLVLGGLSVPGISMLDEMPASLTSQISINASGLEFKNLSGQFSDSAYSGNLNLAKIVAARPKLSGQMHLDTISLAFLRNLVLGASLDGLGEQNAFTKAFLLGLDGDLAITADQIKMGIGDPALGYSSRVVLLNGNINLNDASMAWMGGNASGNLSIQNTEGTGLISGQYQLTEGKLGQLFAAVGKAPFITGGFASAGSFDGSGRSKKALLAGMTGSGIISVKGAQIPGLNPQALGQILLATDVDGFEIEGSRVHEIVDETVLDQSFDLGDYSEAYSLVQGSLLLRNIAIKTKDLQLSARASLNLANMDTRANLRLAYEAGKEAVAGAAPEVALEWKGNFPTLTRTLDTQGMEGYLSIRAYEREQRRVELLQAAILEKQRLRREIIRTNARSNYKIYIAELERLKAEAELKRLFEIEALLDKERQVEEEARLKVLDEQERQRKLDEAKLEKKRKAAEKIRKRKEAAAKKREAARIKKAKAIALKEQKVRSLRSKKVAADAKKRREQEQKILRQRALDERKKRAAAEKLIQKERDRKEADDAFKKLLEQAERNRVEGLPVGNAETIEQGGVVRQELAPPTKATQPSSLDGNSVDRNKLLQDLDALLFKKN